MHWLALGIALLVALGIILIGALYVSRPRAAVRSFGLPLPEDGPNIAWWLRLKGVRDIAAGLTVLAMMVWGGPQMPSSQSATCWSFLRPKARRGGPSACTA